MPIEPINGVSLRPELLAPRRQNQTQQPNPRLQEMIQAGRSTSALLSTLPGPNLSFFQPAAPPQGVLPASGPTAGGPSAPQQRLNAPLLEMEQQGRVASVLLSPFMGQNERAFPAPSPAVFGERNGAGLSTSAMSGGAPSSAASLTSARLPPAGAQLLETEQTGRTTSALLSGLAGPGNSFGRPALMQPSVGAAGVNSLSTMRAAEEVIQAVQTTPPSPLNTRIANEAYQMETQAQQEYTRRAADGERNWEWFA